MDQVINEDGIVIGERLWTGNYSHGRRRLEQHVGEAEMGRRSRLAREFIGEFYEVTSGEADRVTMREVWEHYKREMMTRGEAIVRRWDFISFLIREGANPGTTTRNTDVFMGLRRRSGAA